MFSSWLHASPDAYASHSGEQKGVWVPGGQVVGSSIALETVVDYLNVALERHLARLEAGCMEFLLENFDMVCAHPGIC